MKTKRNVKSKNKTLEMKVSCLEHMVLYDDDDNAKLTFGRIYELIFFVCFSMLPLHNNAYLSLFKHHYLRRVFRIL